MQTNTDKRAKEHHLPSNVFVTYASESQLIPALMGGKIGAIARGEIGNKYQESQNKELITIAHKSFGEKFAFAIDNSNQDLAKNLNNAISKITYNGKITYLQWVENHAVFLDRVKDLDAAT